MMTELYSELGRVYSVFFGIEDHGILTFTLTIEFGAASQGFGNIGLAHHDRDKDIWLDENGAGMTLIHNILDFFGARTFEEINGKTVFALRREPFGDIIGLQRPKHDGGGVFLLDDWRKKFWPEKYS